MKKTNMTAIEFFNEQLGNILELYPSEWEKVNKVFEEANKMFEYQVKDAYIEGYSAPENLGDSENFYNETYKNV